MDRCILEAAIARIASSDLRNRLLLRGSFLTSHWVGPGIRKCDDLDFLALGSFENPSRNFSHFSDALRTALGQPLDDHVEFLVDQMSVEVIFEETAWPGLRLTVPLESTSDHKLNLEQYETPLQIDLGFNDPLPKPQPTFEFETAVGKVELTGSSPELAFAWKLHGLVEREGLGWRAKDLADLWLLQNRFPFDQTKLKAAIKLAFESRDGPLWRLDRLVHRRLGRTSGSRRRYARFLREFSFNGHGYPAELRSLVDDVAKKIEPTIAELNQKTEGSTNKSSIITLGPFDFAVNIAKDEFLSACQGSHFRTYRCNETITIVRERANAKPLPLHHIATTTEHRKCNLQREARGITFDALGNVVARPYAHFGTSITIDDADRENRHAIRESDFQNAIVLEKLDGSLVFPTPDSNDGNWYLRTRRGRSEIAESAFKFAGSQDRDQKTSYFQLIEFCLENSLTPIFEWCSRSRWIVFDHPYDRLVLTGIRDNADGMLMDYDAMRALVSSGDVELVAQLQKPQSLRVLIQQISKLTESEGCILRLKDSRQFKIKSNRYAWLHRAVEGPCRDRARWYLWAIGAKDQLNRCSTGRGLNLDDYFEKLGEAVIGFAKTIDDELKDFAARQGSQYERSKIRKRLAEWLEPKPALESRLAFLAFDGACLETAIRKVIANRCDSEQVFRSLATKINGPLLGD